VRGELRTAHDLGVRLLGLADAARDPALLVEAHRVVGATLFFLGDFARAHEHLEAGIELYDFRAHGAHAALFGQDPGVSCLSYGAVVLWHLGHPDRALEAADESLVLAERVGHPFSTAFAFDMAAAVHQFRREPAPTRERADRAIALATEHGFPLWAAYGHVLRGWAAVQERRRAGQMRELREGLTAWRATGAQIVGPYLLGMIAEAYWHRGRPEKALPLLTEALARVEASGEGWWEPELRRLEGVMLLAGHAPRPADAERRLVDALACARRRGAKGHELRAATSLARLLAHRGEDGAARALVREVQAGFVEGHATPDQVEAGAFLGPPDQATRVAELEIDASGYSSTTR
jgi:predicted ATPase